MGAIGIIVIVAIFLVFLWIVAGHKPPPPPPPDEDQKSDNGSDKPGVSKDPPRDFEQPVQSPPVKIPAIRLIFKLDDGNEESSSKKLEGKSLILLGRQKPSKPDMEFVMVPGDDVSRQQAILEFDAKQKQFLIRRHPQATSDTWVNGGIVSFADETILKDKDQLRFGAHTMVEFRLEEAWGRDQKKR